MMLAQLHFWVALFILLIQCWANTGKGGLFIIILPMVGSMLAQENCRLQANISAVLADYQCYWHWANIGPPGLTVFQPFFNPPYLYRTNVDKTFCQRYQGAGLEKKANKSCWWNSRRNVIADDVLQQNIIINIIIKKRWLCTVPHGVASHAQ